MKRPFLYMALAGVFVCLWHAEEAFGQHQIHHQSPTVVERESTAEFSFEVPGINPGNVQDAFLFFRFNGDLAFRQEKLELSGSVFRTGLDIPAGSASGLEYYMQIQYIDGGIQNYPAGGPTGNPIHVEIVEGRQDDLADSGTTSGIEYTILSPHQGDEVLPEDVVIAITLFYDESEVDTTNTSFQLMLDGEDITKQADASAYFLTYVPERLDMGLHTVSLHLVSEDAIEEIVSWDFSVTGTAETLVLGPQTNSESWMPAGQAELGARNQMIAGSTNDVLSGNFRLNGQKGNIRYTAYGLLTSQEDPRLQPQNRYGAELYVGNWLELQAGHIYPSLSPLTVSGQRVQGVNAALRPFDGAINLQLVYGKLRRQIANLYDPVQVLPQTFNGVTVDTSYSLIIGENGYGTYERDMIGGRLGFGRGRNFQWGFNILKVQDDTASIDVINDYDDLINKRPGMVQDLTQEDKEKLEANPDLLNVNGNPVPKGNFVAGTDLMFNIHKNNIQFRADGALSLLNEDISGGILTMERAEDLGFEIDSDVESLLDQLSWLIIVNENMSSLPLRFNTSGEETTAEAFFPTGILATQSELSLNYLNNNLRLRYRWVGPDFSSLANSTVRKDISGYTLSDRFRLLNNRIYVTLGYENLNDNVIGNKDATTNTVTLRSNVSWYPIKRELPRLSLGIMSRNRDNGFDLFNPYITPTLQSVAVNNYSEEDGTTVSAPNARLSNTIQFSSSISQQFELLGLTHDASLNYSLLNTTDEFFGYGDARSNSVSFYLTNRFREMPLDTQIGFSINNTKTGSGLTDIKIVGLNLGGSMYLLDDQLYVNAAVAFTKNKTEVTPLVINENGTTSDNSDDFYEPDETATVNSNSNSYIFSASARYDLDRSHAFVVDMRFTNVTSPLSTVTLPNDRLIQARYIFSF